MRWILTTRSELHVCDVVMIVLTGGRRRDHGSVDWTAEQHELTPKSGSCQGGALYNVKSSAEDLSS
ncbi:uncharacterized protein BCR38DRAFT_426673 [Pseudomassariella vexata]|uniref:Uncharacterized protein n=1 Tax=Pseudomassariella vexata TaxID=1141098 RepID=A0A1Y2E794_9PEZI|nr:uncharacterized protein BCR38DRAFT_426673 [Pseudomassariella vexata]ORY67307.1 hypothetical protein BCR38DRAFT_426673 [Pseudomassariella vexata]